MAIQFLKKFFGNKKQAVGNNDVQVLGINLQDIQVLPMSDGTHLTEEMRKIVYKVFDHYQLLEKFRGYRKYFIYVSDQVLVKQTVKEAHKIWTDLLRLDTFENIPHQKSDALCVENLLLVQFECIHKQTPNMGSWYGFKGYFLSLLIDSKNLSIWDARGEVTK
jgi:hypothetical protein